MPGIEIYGQQAQWSDLAVIGLLVLLEGVLSIDNALVLGLLAKRLPRPQQSRALVYGLVGAFVFRTLAISTASFLLQWRVVKLLGGGYLVYIAVRHLFFESREEREGEIVVGPDGRPVLVDVETGQPLTHDDETVELQERVPVPLPAEITEAEGSDGADSTQPIPGGYPLKTVESTRKIGAHTARFWPTVLVIELTDIAFAVDSILAAIALVGPAPKGHPAGALHPKLWVVVMGGLLGVILMRFAAVIFIQLLERFPRFEVSAYLLVTVIGSKLLSDWWFNTAEHPHRLDFHDWTHPAFWVFWILMLVCFGIGFIGQRPPPPSDTG